MEGRKEEGKEAGRESKGGRQDKPRMRKTSGKNNTNHYYYWKSKEELVSEAGKICKKADPKDKEKGDQKENIRKSENYSHDQFWLIYKEKMKLLLDK